MYKLNFVQASWFRRTNEREI